MARRLHENCRQEGRVDMLIGRKLKGFTRDEKRRDRRTPVALPMQVGSAHATMTDISLGGFAFEADSGRVQIGSASCRERVCPYVYISVVAVSFKQKQLKYTQNRTPRTTHTSRSVTSRTSNE